MAEVEWAPRAIKDINEIAEFIAKDSVRYAEEQVRLFFRAASQLETHPYRGRIVPELSMPAIRQILCGHYRIIYEVVSSKRIGILTVHHQARLLRNNPAVRKFRKK
ncbi:MAG TPA: type II toxin-antitoxin system RelE/ParE family toxin [Puia sp.]|uniref:type II toxin-antitoxin system RelE/ParE family toxin n=1 Tax=Puia sp. TaxID=2045100 RepID=UPI002D03BFF8|nr:type II toxin-antitoxin system RelE/ParE family toxin [Puia sp.]HVU96215.1 type II toxin-antitoxin system RelE/ParE family toxin [Puia sp.]